MSVYSTSERPPARIAVLQVVSLSLLAVQACIGVGRRSAAAFAVVAALLVVAFAAALAERGREGRTVPTLVALLGVASLSPLPWQVDMLVAVTLLALLARPSRAGVDGRPAWCSRERLMIPWTALVGGVTPFALFAWLELAHPDLRDVRAAVPAVPFALLLAGAAVFVLVNAALEEVIWRGVVQTSLTQSVGPAWAIALQAISFGVQHAHGIPRGGAGVLLAGTWALMLGVLRARSRGLLAPMVAHVIADATIAVIVLSRAR